LASPADSLDLEAIDGVIVGGESGPKARPMNRTSIASTLSADGLMAPALQEA